MIVDPHKVMFSLLGNGTISWINQKNITLLCCEQKLNTWQLPKQQGNQCDFHHYLELSINCE
jgi:hypothetical protein